MRRYAMNTRVNSVTNDDVDCAAPVELAQIQDPLFL